jgi:hypothetical protein
VLRAAELRDWVEAGGYDRVLRGEYRHRADGPTPYKDDLAAAARAYREDAQSFARQFTDALRQTRDRFTDFTRPAEP